MEPFISNAIAMYGVAGRLWIKSIPHIIQGYIDRYKLREVKIYERLSYNFIAYGIMDDRPVMLKLGYDPILVEREYLALKHFQDHGGIKVLVRDEGMLILERIEPGVTLFDAPDTDKPRIACEVMRRLHQAPRIPEHFQADHLVDQLAILDRDWEKIPHEQLQAARKMRDNLIARFTMDTFLHGDLHYDNILQHGDSWAVIDPKGVIGHPINELWNLIFDIHSEAEFVADYFGFDVQDVRDWYFVQVSLAACYILQDNIEDDKFLQLASQAYNLISK